MTEETSTEIVSVNQNYLEPSKFDHMLRVSKAFAQSDLVPDHFRGRIENCFIALQMAFRLDIDPMMCLQNMHIIHGKPGVSAQLVIALAARSRVFEGPIEFVVNGQGDQLSVTATATLRATKRQVTDTVSLAQARAAGWTRQKDGNEKPFWKARPDQMLRYRSATFLVRTYAPEALLGMRTDDELWDEVHPGIEAQKPVELPAPVASVEQQAKVEKALSRKRKIEPEAAAPIFAPVPAPAPVQESVSTTAESDVIDV